MGLGPRFSIAGQDPIPRGNPNPMRFTILCSEQVGPHAVIKVRYHGVTNYEGTKVIVYLNTSVADIERQTALDPHFTIDPGIRPFARFEPTLRGWSAAKTLAVMLTEPEES